MDFMTPPMFDPFNILVWKTRMSIYLKTLGLHVYLAITKKSYSNDSNHIGANAQALEAIRSTLPKDLMLVSNLDSAFVVWNKLTTTTTSELQLQIQQEEESSGESESQCQLVQGNDSLEVQSETQLDSDDCASSSNDLSLIHI